MLQSCWFPSQSDSGHPADWLLVKIGPITSTHESRSMHGKIVITIAAITAALSLAGFLPGATVLVLALAIGVAVLGVPHGGLDHWTGRQRFQSLAKPSLERWWPIFFFPIYAAVAIAVVASWNIFPILTLVGFVVMSARHFGSEDGHTGLIPAIGWGGLVLWVPIWCRGPEMQELISMVMPTLSTSQLVTSMMLLRCIGLCAVVGAIVVTIATSVRWDRSLVVWSVLAAVAPIPVSFGIYFCGWHSVRGLKRLRIEHEQTWRQLIVAVAPLSLAATGLIIAGGWTLARSGGVDAAIVQTLFIGLSAIAVPHMILHEQTLANFPKHVSAIDAVSPEVTS